MATEMPMREPKTMTMKMKHHETRITHGDNGGMTVEHHMKMDTDGDEYPRTVKKITNHYGSGEHEKAMKDVRSMCCGDVTEEQPGAVRTGRVERQKMAETRAKVG